VTPLPRRLDSLHRRLRPERGGAGDRDSGIGHVRPRVLIVVNDPPAEGDIRLTGLFRWNDPMRLAREYIADLRECSGGYLDYEIVGRVDDDAWPARNDGFRYDATTFLEDWRARRPRHRYQFTADHAARIRELALEARLRRNEFDEVWYFSFPYSGDYESIMAGPGAFWCNAPAMPGTGHHPRRWVMMGFNYERDVDCMLENFGHRVESIMRQVYRSHPDAKNMWRRFIRYDQEHPGRSECGNVHFAPNSERDYDWANPRPVPSFCDDWLTYPHLPRQQRVVACDEWGCGMRSHHRWWLSHLPRAAGETDGIANNWWQYVVDPNLVR
jgi:hypothetical protein